MEPSEFDDEGIPEIAPGLLWHDLGKGRSELIPIAYGLPLDGPPRPEHAQALELYCACKCDRLAELIERGPGFRTPQHRRDFWIMMQVWARFVLDQRAPAEERAQARRAERELAKTLARLQRDADALCAAVTRQSEVRAVLFRNVVATRPLAQELRSFSAAMERIRIRHRRRGQPAGSPELKEALALLGEFYQQATGKRPTVVVSEQPGRRGHAAGGPSLAFAQAAMAPLFPQAGSLVDDWRAVSKEMRAQQQQ